VAEPSRSIKNPAVLARSDRISDRILLELADFWPWPESGNILASFNRNLVCRHPATVARCPRIRITGCFRIPALTGFWRPPNLEFRLSDIKRACKDEEFNFEKRFMVLKIVNRFPKIKETFTVKLKIIFVDHYFRPY